MYRVDTSMHLSSVSYILFEKYLLIKELYFLESRKRISKLGVCSGVLPVGPVRADTPPSRPDVLTPPSPTPLICLTNNHGTH